MVTLRNRFHAQNNEVLLIEKQQQRPQSHQLPPSFTSQLHWKKSATLPLDSNDSNSLSRRLSTQSLFSSWKTKIVGVVIALIPWMYPIWLSKQAEVVQKNLEHINWEQSKINREMRWVSEGLKKAKMESSQADDARKEMLAELRRQGDNVNIDTAEYKRAEQLEEGYMNRLESLRNTIAAVSTRHMQLWGPPIHVKFFLENDQSFTVELAPITVAPHATSHFLRLVEARLYDGLTLLHRNHGQSNIIHSASMNTKTGTMDDNRFTKVKFPELPYIEGSQGFSNEKYSVLFSERGPHFYVNMGTPSISDEVDEKESCFGKVVQGHEVLDKLMAFDTKSLSMIGIQYVRIVTADD